MPDKIISKTIEAKIYSFNIWIEETEAVNLKTIFEGLLKKSAFNILKFSDYHFPIKGYTCFWLLAESHLAIHTFPDDKKSYVELSSCNKEKLDVFVNTLKNIEF
ncbi:S-adenosylmethionine decarboxylase [Aquimarina brevivitae]|uniref:S-adenosylmethionine decarboxylase n=1 Tax=Aquimarina brevivitae TaxID=323412 RepID=A0A4Q7PHI0_9FLAO|nr:S-adenosylmethionine decarboxylase [Aquimarina brevivitae]RZT00005.1 S-adenosylmethionine decarboxylase [Aquimarina brevivitae]